MLCAADECASITHYERSRSSLSPGRYNPEGKARHTCSSCISCLPSQAWLSSWLVLQTARKHIAYNMCWMSKARSLPSHSWYFSSSYTRQVDCGKWCPRTTHRVFFVPNPQDSSYIYSDQCRNHRDHGRFHFREAASPPRNLYLEPSYFPFRAIPSRIFVPRFVFRLIALKRLNNSAGGARYG